MLNVLKDELILKMNPDNNALQQKLNADNAALKEEIKTGSEKIREEVTELRKTVDENSKSICSITQRLEVLKERTYPSVAAENCQPENNIPAERNVWSHMRANHVLNLAKMRVGLFPINLEDLNRMAAAKKVRGDICLRYTVIKFLNELKKDDREINNLRDLTVSHYNSEDNDKVYVTFTDVKHVEYLYKKSALCKNATIRVFPYIPPQFFKRFLDLSRHTFHARKSDPRLKTMV